MTFTELAFLFLGAALISLGVLASALADRIRGIRLMRAVTWEAREAPLRDPPPRATVVERHARAERERAAPAEGSPPRGTPVPHNAGMAADVVAALVNAGYRKAAAAQAVSACSPNEQVSLAQWTLAALRRCSRVEAS